MKSFKTSVLGIICFLGILASAEAKRIIPDNNLAYPVMYSSANSKASGFFLGTDKYIYFVTACHVIFNGDESLKDKNAELLSYPGDVKESGRNVFLLDLETLNKARMIRFLQGEDIAIIKIGKKEKKEIKDKDKFAIEPSRGVLFKETTSSGIISASVSAVKKFDQILVANDIYVFGYPSSLGMGNESRLDLSRPLLRKGMVAGTHFEKKTIVLDCALYKGNSGGPVLEVEEEGAFNKRFYIIGVVIQSVPFVEEWINTVSGQKNYTVSNSGYSVAASMDAVLDLLLLE